MQISAFDLDHTLVGTNSSLLFYRYLIERGIYRHASILRTFIYSMRHYFFDLTLKELHEKVFERFLKGAPLALVQEEVKRFLKKDFYRFLYYPTFSRLRLAQHEGHHTVILSTGPSFLVGPIADYLGVSEWGSSMYSVDKEGKFNGIDSIFLGEGKASYIRQLTQKFKTDFQEVTVYSDSIEDLPFLSIGGKAVVVNPGFKMKKISQEKLWEVI
ncbi:MAG: HAD-IB family hydrolase [Chlamydiia bacterium]|nr:HAD-IB family hydrolase [Chlamydiia bacterium]